LAGPDSLTRRAREGKDAANGDAADGNVSLRLCLETPNVPMPPVQCHVGISQRFSECGRLSGQRAKWVGESGEACSSAEQPGG
jgi:hypothetical protein